MERTTIKLLKEIVGRNHVTTVVEDLHCYSYDSSGLELQPSAVVFPGSVEEISRIMQLANSSGLSIIPRGAGTGMTGGALAVEGGMVMALGRLNRILEIDNDNHLAVVEPGVITGQFQAEVRRQNLFYPPDPASKNFCTMGGNVANCAGGPSAVKYGVTRDYVLGLEAVLADGNIINTGVKTAKGVMGYDLTRLLIGSEGTLGIITKIIVRLLALPARKNTFLVMCGSLKYATGLVSRILSSGILPSTLEYMDRNALQVVDSYLAGQLPTNIEALLLIEVDGDDYAVAGQSKRLMSLLADQIGPSEILEIKQAKDPEEIDALWQARRAISPASFKLKPHKISEDVVVPRTKIPELVAKTEQLADEYNLPILTFGHAGDGNIHVNIMLNKDDQDELQRGISAKHELFHHVISLGGTLSGEHGVGLTKAPFLSMDVDASSLAVMKNIKKVFDPNNILNPGKIFGVAKEE